ncbi:ABC transporter permease [Kluyvera genomosp. 2]|uniref:ABC transporter permease n=1 Tax=Kluyvera genomosp. 2 TaxID=2774054 RepID=UPI002FD7D8AC
MNLALSIAKNDLVGSFENWSLIGILGWQDVKQRYRRSALGPFWLTISMGVMIGSIGLVFGHIFKSPIAEYLPFLAIGMIIWSFITSVINEGCLGFVNAEGVIKQMPLPLALHIARVVWRNIIILGHNLLIVPILFVVIGKYFEWSAIIAIPGLFLLIANVAWMALILGVICTRYRDLPQIVMSLIQVAYFLTPIIWMPSQLSERASFLLLSLNPAYHTIELVRAPLLGQLPLLENWVFSLVFCAIGWILTMLVFGKFKRRIAYWL